MIETYRQIQVLLIEGDYDKRVAVANQVADSKERDRILLLAQQEHDQRIAKLQQTLKGFNSAYEPVHKELQTKTGGEVVTQMSPEEANAELRNFRPFTPQEFKMENQPSSLLPAGARMLYGDKRY